MSNWYLCYIASVRLVVHHSLFTGDPSGAARRRASAGRIERQQQVVTYQRRQHAEQAGFRPIDKPTLTSGVKSKTPSGLKDRHHSTGKGPEKRRNSDSSNNPLSGDEYY
jgi:hypothetical protein